MFPKFNESYKDNYGFILVELLKKEIDKNYKSNFDELLNFYEKSSHKEFCMYYILKIIINNESNLKILKKKKKYGKTKVTNWRLMRFYIKYFFREISLIKIKKFIQKVQDDSGLIWDEKNKDKSFQYHCFSSSIILDFYNLTKDIFFLNSFKKSVEFIEKFILPNGMSLYVGRGQEQIFGYGCLLYILSSYCLLFKNHENFLLKNMLIEKYILKFIKKDKTLPLVLNKYSKILNCDIHSPGWYSYNTIKDYYPFFLYYYNLFLENKKEFNKNNQKPIFKEYDDDEFIIRNTNFYMLIVSKSTKINSNNLSFPLIYHKKTKRILTPFHGGEEFMRNGFFQKNQISLPYFLFKKQWHYLSEIKSLLKENKLIIENKNFSFIRKFLFKEKEIIVLDEIKFKKNIFIEYIVFENYSFLDDEKNIFKEYEYKKEYFIFNKGKRFFKSCINKNFKKNMKISNKIILKLN